MPCAAALFSSKSAAPFCSAPRKPSIFRPPKILPTFALSRCDWKSAESIALAKSGPNLSFAAFVAAVSSAAERSSPLSPVLASVEAMLRSSSAAMGTREPSEEIVLSSASPPSTLPAIPCERSALVRAASACASPNLSRPTVAIARPATTATVATARSATFPAKIATTARAKLANTVHTRRGRPGSVIDGSIPRAGRW
jgi:hypothetical protein